MTAKMQYALSLRMRKLGLPPSVLDVLMETYWERIERGDIIVVLDRGNQIFDLLMMRDKKAKASDAAS